MPIKISVKEHAKRTQVHPRVTDETKYKLERLKVKTGKTVGEIIDELVQPLEEPPGEICEHCRLPRGIIHP